MRFIRFISFVVGCLLCFCAGSYAAEIHTAIISGNVDKISAELAKDASLINQADEKGRTPLHIAAEMKNAEIVKLLLSKGADPAKKDQSGKTPLRVAVDSGSADCVNVIVMKTMAGYVDPLLDVRRKEGMDALKDGSLAKANGILGRLVMLDPTCENINFAYGMSWLSLGDPAPAGVAFERVLQINPANGRARVELARARLAAKRYPEAQKELEKVLSSDLPADVRQTLQACLKDVKQLMTRWYHSGSIELGGIYDSNVNVGPDSALIHITPLNIFGTRITELELSGQTRPADTTGISLSAGARAFYDMGTPNGWFMTYDGNCYRNWLSESDYETGSVQAGVGVKRIFDKGFLQTPFRVRYIEYGGEPLLWVYGLYPSFVYAPPSMNGVSFITISSVELRDFDTFSDRDGYYLSLAEIARKSFLHGRYSLYGGGEIQHDHADSSEYEYTGAGLMAGGEARLPWRLNLFGEARYFYRNYKGRNVLAPDNRNDDMYQFSAGISRDITDRIGASLTHTIINNDSSFDLYEYKREITTLSTNIRF